MSLGTRSSREDRLLQVADLVTSGVHQVCRPSGNPIKEESASLISRLVWKPGAIGNCRIDWWEWKPAAVILSQNEE